MDLAELQARIGSHTDVDLAAQLAAYQEQTGSDDLNGFVRFLLSQGIIDIDTFAELHATGNVEVTPIADPEAAKTAFGDQPTAHDPSSAPETGPAEAEDHGDDEPPRYELMAELGKGAMGAVHIARDVFLRRSVAFKSILPAMQQRPQVFTRFLTEMQITAQLDHPNIVPIYGLEVGPDGVVAYAMKLVQGKEFGALVSEAKATLEADEPLDDDHTLEARLEAFLKVCDAVSFAHEKGIIHRDLKPANIMLGRYNEVYLMDWGIARPMGEGGKAVDAGIELYDAEGDALDTHRTRLGTALGTPLYMSPEQAAGRNDELDGRSDLYALGLILQEVVTLKRAIGGTTIKEVFTNAKQGVKEPPTPPRAMGDIPWELMAIINKATRVSPSERYATVAEFADDIRRFLRNEEIVAQRDNAFQKVARWVSKNRTTSVLIMMALLLAGAASAIALLLHNRAVVAEQHTRELRLSEFQTQSALRAHALDKQLQRYEAALTQLVGATQMVLSRGQPSGAAVYFEGAFSGKQAGPADLVDSPYYGSKVSTSSPVFGLCPGTARDAVQGPLEVLPSLVPVLHEVMVESRGDDAHKLSAAAKRKAIVESGAPVHRVHITLEAGLHLAFPGMAGPAQDGDLRTRPPYRLAKATAGVHWGEPVAGKQARGLIVSVSAALYDERDHFRGVAQFQVGLAQLIGQLALDELDYVDSTMLVKRDGSILAGQRARKAEPEPFELPPELVAAIRQGQSGYVQAKRKGQDVLATYYPLNTTSWYYVGIATLQKMLAGGAAPPMGTAAPRRTATTTAMPPPTSATASATAHEGVDGRDGGVGTGGATVADAGADAAAPAAPALPQPTYTWPPATTAPTATPAAAPSGPGPNPFDKWKQYDQDGKKGRGP